MSQMYSVSMQCKPEWAYKLEVVEYCINTSLATLLGGRKKLQEKLGVSRAIRRGTRQRPIESGVPFYSMSGGLCRCEHVAIFHERTALPISHATKPLSCPSLSLRLEPVLRFAECPPGSFSEHAVTL